jgi:peptide chain release factor 3
VRWISSNDKAALAAFLEKQKSSIATDLDGDTVFLPTSEFNLRFVTERNPAIKFSDVKEIKAG